jgi:hypothetical protein
MLAALSANHSHLYPGARLVSNSSQVIRPSESELVLEFSDGAHTTAIWQNMDGNQILLMVSGYRTAKGHNIGAKAWRLELVEDRVRPTWRIVGRDY